MDANVRKSEVTAATAASAWLGPAGAAPPGSSRLARSYLREFAFVCVKS
jgi:hypothetical protein